MNQEEFLDERATHWPQCPECLEDLDIPGFARESEDLPPREQLERLGMTCPSCGWGAKTTLTADDDGGFEVGQRVRIIPCNGSGPAIDPATILVHRSGELVRFGELNGQTGWFVALDEPVEDMMGQVHYTAIIEPQNLETELCAG